MSRSSYGSPPKGPNKGSAGTPNTSQPVVSSVPNKIRQPQSTPGVDQNLDSDDGLYTPGIGAGPMRGSGNGGRSDQGRNTPKPGY